MKSAVYCGSFYPVTKGHVNLIERASALCGTLYVVVANNTTKTYFIPPEARLEMLRAATANLPNVVCTLETGTISEFCKRRGVNVIIKGVRNVFDMQSEMDMADINKKLCGAETVCLTAEIQYRAVSSTLVRELALVGGDISPLVPECIVDTILKYFSAADCPSADAKKP